MGAVLTPSTVSDEVFKFVRKRETKKAIRAAKCFNRKADREYRKKNFFKAGFCWMVAEEFMKKASQIAMTTRCSLGDVVVIGIGGNVRNA